MKRDSATQRNNSRKSPYRAGIPGHADRGQRYEVRYRDGMGTERSFGFTNNAAELPSMIKKLGRNPAWKYTRTIDREMRATAEDVRKLEAAGG